MRALCLALALIASPAMAQEATQNGSGVAIRALDKLTGKVSDMQLPAGQMQSVGRIEIAAEQCRYPDGNPAGDAYAWLTVRELGVPEPVFRGWMIASAPALNALDHPRYDVWVLRCTTS
ncbi:DUF2155 domain-containing protein [Litorisediminicola beolgyonensis]|uniref:DUF2155 domain-containing protein n=1 Tax=Litorisediminicola beolgyonensis TaxID=1173614 RepID=A0ABW3ZF86_9RHOB